MSNHDQSAEFPVQKRRRGVVISSQGWQRLQAAEYLAAVRDNGGNLYTLEQLSDRTGLSPKTLTKREFDGEEGAKSLLCKNLLKWDSRER